MTKPKILLENVGKTFRTRRQEIEALRDINMKVYEHEIVSLIGPSGCGKSTIIRLLDDIIKPTCGKITVDNYEYSGKPVPKDVIRNFGFVFQHPNLLPWMTVRKNMLFPLRVFGDKDPKWNEYVEKLLDMANMLEYADAYPDQLSGGMLQRVGVLRAMTHQPPILLMDEPFGALDEVLREQLDMETMRMRKQLNQTILFVTHNIKEAVFVSDRVYVLDTRPGRIVDEIVIDLPRERTKEVCATRKYNEYVIDLTNKIGTVDLKLIK